MSEPLPQWLRSCLQDSHLTFALSTLDSRERQREAARIVRASYPPNPRARLPFFSRPSATSHLKDHFSCSVGQQSAHKRANRYLNLEPYNRTRVLVPRPDCQGRLKGDSAVPHASDGRYLNANWIRESAGGKWWIGGQAPLPNTAHAFWTLTLCRTAPPSTSSRSSSPPIRARRVHTIVQLTPMIESGRRRAHPYFPGGLHQDMIISPEPGCDSASIYVYVANEERIDSAQCIRTDLRLRWASSRGEGDVEGLGPEERKVTHLFYTGWPDFGVPEDNHTILNFARLVEDVNNRHLDHPSDDANASPPIIVHCSAGVGRTGSFIALCSLLRAYSLLSSPHTSNAKLKPSLAPPLPASPLGALPEALDEDIIAQEIDNLREQRNAMVQKEEQAVWVYEALKDAFDGL